MRLSTSCSSGAFHRCAGGRAGGCRNRRAACRTQPTWCRTRCFGDAPARGVRSAPSGCAASLPPAGGDEPHSRRGPSAPTPSAADRVSGGPGGSRAVSTRSSDRRRKSAARTTRRSFGSSRRIARPSSAAWRCRYSYEELTLVLNKPSPAAARMTVTRAMKRLADELRHAPTAGD